MLAASVSNVYVLAMLLRAEESSAELQEAGFNLLLSPIEYGNLEVIELVLKALMERGTMTDFEVHDLVRYAARHSTAEPLSLILLEFMEFAEEDEILEWAMEALDADNLATFIWAFSVLLPGFLSLHPGFFADLVFEAISLGSYSCFGWLFANSTNYTSVDLSQLQSEFSAANLIKMVTDIIQGSYCTAMEALIRVFHIDVSSLHLPMGDGVSDVIFLAGVVYESSPPHYEEEALKVLEFLLDEGGCSVDGWWRGTGADHHDMERGSTTILAEAARDGCTRLSEVLRRRLPAVQQANSPLLQAF